MKAITYSVLCAAVCILLLTTAVLGFALYRQSQVSSTSTVQSQNEKLTLSLAYGYTDNFLFPVIEYIIKNNDDEARVYVFLSADTDGIAHIKDAFGAESLKRTLLNTRLLERGSTVIEIASNETNYLPTYLDFVSGTNIFLKIAEHSKQHYSEFANQSTEAMIQDLIETFKHQVYSILGGTSMFVEFFSDADEMIEKIKTREIK